MTEPRQDSTTDQLRDVIALANRAGCYDAADWIKKHQAIVRAYDEQARTLLPAQDPTREACEPIDWGA